MYQVCKTCKDCGLEYAVEMTKDEAIFFQFSNEKIEQAHCTRCGSVSYTQVVFPKIGLDEDSFDKWARDEQLNFFEQDEDLMLASTDVGLLTRMIDKKDILSSKRNILISALCIIVYDKDDGCEYVLNILSSRTHMLEAARADIYDYLGKEVYPQLGLEWKMKMKIKVCGMKYPDNIKALGKLPIDFMGMIFYEKSARYIGALSPDNLDAALPDNIARVGVFVNAEIAHVLKIIEEYGLHAIQLHGDESAQYCLECWNLTNVEVIKAFSISEAADFEKTKEYEDICQYFLFDTKTPLYGGSGQKFDWSILNSYTEETPFLLSGGITADDVEAIREIRHPQFAGVDLNSRFEAEPGLKDIGLLDKFLKELRYEQN